MHAGTKKYILTGSELARNERERDLVDSLIKNVNLGYNSSEKGTYLAGDF